MTMTTKELLALAADWRRAAHQLRGDCEPMPASAMRLDECADELEAALASDTGGRGLSVAQGQGWLPIESAPLHVPILMLMKHGAIQGRWDGETGSGYYWRDMEWYATHWMPLPAAPAQPDGVGK